MVVLNFDNSRQVTVRLSSSGKALLFYDESGNSFMTSVAYMRMLLDGKANGNMLKLNYIGTTVATRFNPHLIQKGEGDPLSDKANQERTANSVKVKGDDW